MPAVRILLAALVFGFALQADTLAPREAPSYSGASIVNAADNQPGPLAPNAIATIYGTNLATTTKAVASSDLQGGLLPTVLPNTGVHVIVGGLLAGIYFVSPNQINFLVPSILIAGTTQVTVTINGLAGPQVSVKIAASSPAFFQLDSTSVIAAHADGSVVTSDSPAKAGEYIVLYATGLGQVVPPLSDRELPTRIASIALLSQLQVMLDSVPLDRSLILYAGVSPGFGGLYQINLKLPDSLGSNPQIQVALAGQTSPAGVKLWTSY